MPFVFRRAALVASLILAACSSSEAPGGSGSGGGDGSGSGLGSGSGGGITDDNALRGILRAPSVDRPWTGAVIVNLGGKTAAGWHVDGHEMPYPTPQHPILLLDTRTLDDGPHTLSLDVPVDGEVQNFTGTFLVENGPAVEPAFTGALVDVTDASGVVLLSPGGPAPRLAGAVAGDLDGDGDLDLFGWSTAPPSIFAQVYLQTAPLVFEPAGPPMGLFVIGAGMADLDGDGRSDVVVVGSDVRIFHSAGGGSLTDVSAASGLPKAAPGMIGSYHGVTFADVDADGLTDVALGGFECTNAQVPSFVLRNEGQMRFSDVAPALGLALGDHATFNFAMEMPGEDGVLHVWPFNETCRNPPRMTRHYRFVEGPDLPVLLDVAEPSINIAPMGSAWIDGDADGALDHWVAGDFESPLWTAPGFDGSASAHAGLDAFADPEGFPISTWSMVLFDADLDGRPDVLTTHSSSPLGGTSSAPEGLFWQRAPGKFREVGARAGLVTPNDCKGAHGADLDGDGDTDLLLGCTPRARILRNDLVDPSAGRTVVLHGTVSNPDGIHALLTTPSGEQRMVRGGGQPYQGGLVRETVYAPSGELRVRWPSGIEQRVDVGTSPVLHVTEPAVVHVAPRRVDATAPTPVLVEVAPGLLGDPGAKVVVEPSAGSFVKPLEKGADGVHRGELLPPPGVGTVSLRVTIGAATLRVRPRIYVR